MQELEKILKEIKDERTDIDDYSDAKGRMLARHWNNCIDVVEEIIRKHMNEENDIVEQCPHCGNELALHWTVEKDGYEVYCPYCGFPVMLCSMCNARDGKVCDWTENVGCKHSSERYRDYFGKHMNDGWIPCSERLPEEPPEEVDDEDNLEEYIVMIEGAERPTTLRYAGDGTWCEDGTYYPVIAWQPLPEPYCL